MAKKLALLYLEMVVDQLGLAMSLWARLIVLWDRFFGRPGELSDFQSWLLERYGDLCEVRLFVGELMVALEVA